MHELHSKTKLFEEAGISKKMFKNLEFVSFVNFIEANEFNCKRGSVMISDILLPTSFLPQNKDGEVDEFISMDMNKISELKIRKKIINFILDLSQ